MTTAVSAFWRPLLCVALATIAYLLAPAEGQLAAGLAIFVLIGSLWVTQAVHITLTALLVPVLCVLAGVLSVKDALLPFANPVIFLFMGGFALAAALARHGLDQALAQGVLRLARGRRALAYLLLFGLTALLSMWISNTATAAMMLPLALGLLRRDAAAAGTAGTAGTASKASTAGATGTGGASGAAGSAAAETAHQRERIFVLLGLAYSASIGGIGTLVGSPPNAIAAAQAGISFAQWLAIGLPLVALLLPLMVGMLFLLLRPALSGRVEVPEAQPMAWTRGRVMTLAIFAFTVLGWVGSAPLSSWLGVAADFDTLVALAAIALLGLSGAVRWDDIERGTQWGVLLLFGGGLALSQMMSTTGASRYLADQLVWLVDGAPMIVLLLAVVAFVVLLTELVSNTASAALLVPIFLSVSTALGLSPVGLAAAIAVSASCAFMLPVATPPNAIVFGTGQVPQAMMMRCGLVLNGVCIGVIALVMTRLL